MLSVIQPDRVTIGRMRTRLPMEHAASAQSNAERLLRYASLHPSGLPPQAILCVRQLSEPIASTSWLDHHQASLSLDWQERVRAELEQLSARAATPILGWVPPTAESVLFSDYSEFLACMALDWLSGHLGSHWWWQEIPWLRQTQRGIPAICSHWIDSPQHVPAAFELLSRQHRATDFARAMPSGAAQQIHRAIVAVFAIPFTGNPHVEAAIPPVSEPSTTTAPHDLSPALPPPWTHWAAEASDPALPPAGRLLLAQALMLQRAPSLVRKVEYQRSVAAWLEAQTIPSAATARAKARQIKPAETICSSLDPQARSQNPAPYQESIPQPLQANPTLIEDVEPVLSSEPAFSAVQQPAENDDPASEGGLFDRTAHFHPDAQKIAAPSQEIPIETVAPELSQETSIEAVGPRPVPSTFHTAYAGVFFLLNAALILEIFGDFTRPAAPVPEVGIWQLLTHLGRVFLPEAIASDPLWGCLASLAGDPHHPQDHQPLPSTAARRWLRRTRTQVRTLLRQRMNIPNPEHMLLSIPGRVVCTATSVDIYCSIETHPIEIRIACLDRNPGWIPAAGRYVAFHFD